MTVTMKTIPDIISALKKRKPSALSKNSDKPLSAKEAITQLAPTLLAKKEEGFTTAELVDFLAEHDIAVKAHNLARYLREHGSSAAKPKQNPTLQSPPKPVPSVGPGGHEVSLRQNEPQQ